MMLLLSSCSQVSTNCPSITKYSKASQLQVANELNACFPNCSMITEFLKDYNVNRNQLRSCK